MIWWHCLSSLNFVSPIYYRYVDDIFAIVPRTKTDEILSTFNNYYPRLKFTYEIEQNFSISFLNTMVIRCENILITNWFRKPTWSGKYINYYSNHPTKYKINTIYNLIDHAILLSDDRFHYENINIVRKTLINNCFPEHLIEIHLRKRINFLKNRNRDINFNANREQYLNPFFVSLPFFKDISFDLGRLMRDVGFNVSYRVTKKLNAIIKRGKDCLHNNNRTNVV